MRELYGDTYNNERYTDETVLYKNKLIDPVTLSAGLTYLWGKDSEMFPLLSLTEGQNGLVSLSPKTLNDTQYVWNVMGRMSHVSKVVALVGGHSYPGKGFQPFKVIMEDDTFLRYYGATTADKQSNLRIQGDPVRLGTNRYEFTFRINTADPSAYVAASNFTAGTYWVMAPPSVAASHSDGTSSRSQSPGKWTNQFGYLRFSKNIAGNVANKVVNIEFDLEGGGTTNLWMPHEMKQFEIDRRLMLEEDLWSSIYNRDEYGVIHLIDEETGKPIPKGAGVKEILKTTDQYEAYSTLTVEKLDSVVNRLFANRIDKTPMELVLYTGSGGFRMFNDAIKADAGGNSYYQKLGMEEIMSGKDGYLSYGKYFAQYKTIEGHILTIKRASIFDNGLYAELDKANGNMYKGFPHESYNIIILDQSMTDGGERNIQLVAEKGREVLTGVYKGLTPLPDSWGAIGDGKLLSSKKSPLPDSWGAIGDGKLLSSKKDEASYEVFVSQGLTMKNYTTSYYMEFSR